MTTIPMGGASIGGDAPCFVIAEIGVNHNGEPALAHRLIDVCAEAGADAVKLQTFVPEELAASDAPKAAYQRTAGSDESQVAMLRRLALPASAYPELIEHASEAGLVFLSSPFDESSVELLESLGIVAFKIPSGEVTNHPLLRRIAATRKPVLMSTGMCTLEEVARAVEVLAGGGAAQIALLHCVSAYPADPSDCNLRAMGVLRKRFGVPVGWSDHTVGDAVAIAAVALGAEIIEKHVTLDRELPGPDHQASMEPPELRRMIAGIRAAESAIGRAEKLPVAAEAPIADVARKSLHWRRALPAGHLVDAADLVALRPGHGISPAELDSLLGRPVRAPVEQGAIVRREDLG